MNEKERASSDHNHAPHKFSTKFYETEEQQEVTVRRKPNEADPEGWTEEGWMTRAETIDQDGIKKIWVENPVTKDSKKILASELEVLNPHLEHIGVESTGHELGRKALEGMNLPPSTNDRLTNMRILIGTLTEFSNEGDLHYDIHETKKLLYDQLSDLLSDSSNLSSDERRRLRDFAQLVGRLKTIKTHEDELRHTDTAQKMRTILSSLPLLSTATDQIKERM